MKAVFLDKDGTLVPNIPYNVNPDLIELTIGAQSAILDLKKAGFKLFVVSNQAGVARGYFEEKALAAVWRKLEELCQVKFDGFYFCPHFAGGQIENYSFECDCRKPAPGMLWRAAREFEIDLASSWMIGDALSDVEAGRRAGCRTILLDQANTVDLSAEKFRQPDFRVKNLAEAARIIVES